MVTMMKELENYVFCIWDRLGFQEGETGWVIEVKHNTYGKPQDLSFDPYVGEIILTEEETERLGLEKLFGGYNLWDRGTGDLDLSEFIEGYSPGQDIIDKLLELISEGG
jgi:hypothetical protein